MLTLVQGKWEISLDFSQQLRLVSIGKREGISWNLIIKHPEIVSPKDERTIKAIEKKIADGCTLKVEDLGWDKTLTCKVRLSAFMALPLNRRFHTTFIDNLEEGKAPPCEGRLPWDGLEERLPFVLAPFQREGVAWMAAREARGSSITSPIFRVARLQADDGYPVYLSHPNPSESILWRGYPQARSGGFLCDEPGLGKTIQMVALMNLTGFHFRDTPPWAKGAYGPWLKPSICSAPWLRRTKDNTFTTSTHPFPLATLDAAAEVVAQSTPLWTRFPCPWFNPVAPKGGTLVIFPTTLSSQWETEILDKSADDGIEVLNLSKESSWSLDRLLAADVVLATHGMLRAERRRSAERVAWGDTWRCDKLNRILYEEPHKDLYRLATYDVVQILPWGTEFVVERLEDGGKVVYGWPWHAEMEEVTGLDDIGLPTTAAGFSLKDYDWICPGQLKLCGTQNLVEEGAKRSSLKCGRCGSRPSSRVMGVLSAIDPSPLFRVWWRRIILDESDRLTSMPQTLNDVSLLQSHVLWCLTGTPNGTDPRFGRNFLEQLSLFFVDRSLDKDVGLHIQEWRDPAFQGDLVDLWMLRRTKDEVDHQLSLPPLDFHTLSVDLEENDGREWILAMHRDMAACRSQRFGRLWRVLTIQEGLQDVILVDNMELNLEGPAKDCPVCMDKIEGGACVRTPCGHFFCKTCISTWMVRAPTLKIPCPACRTVLTSKNLKLALEPAVERTFNPGNLSKLRRIQTLLASIPGHERVVIATRYPEAMATLTRVLDCPSLHAKMSKNQREAILGGGWKRCLVISANLHGFGLNLTQANHLIIVDEPSKAHYRTQLVGRLYRIGQERHVHIYRLVTKDTLEEWADTGADLTKVLGAKWGK